MQPDRQLIRSDPATPTVRETWRQRLTRFRRRITYSEPFTGLLAWIAFALISLYRWTLRIEYHDHPEFEALDRTRACYGFWHGRQFLLVPSFGHEKVAIMADLSWAGAIQTKILRRFGYTVVRGSSKRQGARALLAVKKSMQEGNGAAFALDGPSGPIYRSKPGILLLARKLGYPIAPLAASASSSWRLQGTWCRYLLPRPFARCCVGIGPPFEVTGEDMDDQLEALDARVQAWTAELDARVQR